MGDLQEDSYGMTPKARAKEVLFLLKECFPLPFPVRVYWRKMDDCWGDSDVLGKGKKKRAVIRLSNKTIVDQVDDIVMHEYAHLMVYDYYGYNDDGVWAVAYAEIYRVMKGQH